MNKKPTYSNRTKQFQRLHAKQVDNKVLMLCIENFVITIQPNSPCSLAAVQNTNIRKKSNSWNFKNGVELSQSKWLPHLDNNGQKGVQQMFCLNQTSSHSRDAYKKKAETWPPLMTFDSTNINIPLSYCWKCGDSARLYHARTTAIRRFQLYVENG